MYHSPKDPSIINVLEILQDTDIAPESALRWYLPFWFVFQNILPFVIGGFGTAGGGVAFMAHIGGFAAGYAIGFAYKKMYSQNSTYGTRYGWRGD